MEETAVLAAPNVDLNAPMTSDQAKAMAAAQMAKLREFGVPDEGARFQGARFTQATDDKSYKWCYWKRPDGWIVIGPSWPVEFMQRIEWGWTSLGRKYGYFHLTNVEDDGRGTIVAVWHVNQEPYRQIFSRDGAAEFSLAQILESGWHRKAPYKFVKFPQLADGAPVDHECQICHRKFVEAGHLIRHESVMHRDESQNNQMARVMGAGAKVSSDALAEALKLLADRQDRSDKLLTAVLERGQQQDLMIAKLFERLVPVETMTDAEAQADDAAQRAKGHKS